MNGCVFFDGTNHAMAAGMEDVCQLYQLKWKILSAEREGDMLPTKTAETGYCALTYKLFSFFRINIIIN